jgi:hypothetical protein
MGDEPHTGHAPGLPRPSTADLRLYVLFADNPAQNCAK